MPDPARDGSSGIRELVAAQDRLAEALRRHIDERRSQTAVPGLSLHRQDAYTELSDAVYEPSVTVTVAGTKRTIIGPVDVAWSAGRFLITPIEVPVVSQVLAASLEEPYLALMLRLDRAVIADMSTDVAQVPVVADRHDPTAPMDLALTTALTRLVELLDTPDDIRVLAPLIHREVVYRLLMSERADRMRALIGPGHTSSAVDHAARWLREHPAEPLVIADLARRVALSPSSLHHQFKVLTGMSPGQYVKQLRLARARQLMAVHGATAGEAAHSVGYASPAHFSRDYRSVYGAPPGRDARRLRETPSVA